MRFSPGNPCHRNRSGSGTRLWSGSTRHGFWLGRVGKPWSLCISSRSKSLAPRCSCQQTGTAPQGLAGLDSLKWGFEFFNGLNCVRKLRDKVLSNVLFHCSFLSLTNLGYRAWFLCFSDMWTSRPFLVEQVLKQILQWYSKTFGKCLLSTWFLTCPLPLCEKIEQIAQVHLGSPGSFMQYARRSSGTFGSSIP